MLLRMTNQIYIPSLSMAFEYLGEQHYIWNRIMERPEELQKRHSEKVKKTTQAGFVLIDVPYWWDGSESSLKATIAIKRPDLFPDNSAQPIPESPPDAKRGIVYHLI
jgi:hypothetical protein